MSFLTDVLNWKVFYINICFFSSRKARSFKKYLFNCSNLPKAIAYVIATFKFKFTLKLTAIYQRYYLCFCRAFDLWPIHDLTRTMLVSWHKDHDWFWKATTDFLYVVNSNFLSIVYRFRVISDYVYNVLKPEMTS